MSRDLSLNFLNVMADKRVKSFYGFLSWLSIVLKNNLDLNVTCSSVKTLLSPLQSILRHSALNSAMLVFTCVLPNNPKSACGATSFPGCHSFPKWAMGSTCIKTCLSDTLPGVRLLLGRSAPHLFFSLAVFRDAPAQLTKRLKARGY